MKVAARDNKPSGDEYIIVVRVHIKCRTVEISFIIAVQLAFINSILIQRSQSASGFA